MSTTWMCRTCARPTERPPEDGGCVCAGTDARPGKPVAVESGAAEQARDRAGAMYGSNFVGRRSVLPAPRIPGVSAAERAHMVGECAPRSCGRCALVAGMRGTTGKRA